MNRVILLLGANLGNELETFAVAIAQITKRVGGCVIKSSVFVSPPWGFEHFNEFYNQVLVVETQLLPQNVLQQCLEIETDCGRIRKKSGGYQARIIDIDILFYNDEVIDEPRLQIPHPLLHKRRFTLLPLSEILPDFVHPVFKKTSCDLLEECEDKSAVRLFNSIQ